MTTQPKTVAELRKTMLRFTNKCGESILALDDLTRRAEANERLRNAAHAHWIAAERGILSYAESKDLREAIAAAPSQPKDGRDDTLADIRKQLGLAADCETVAITEAVRELREKMEAASVTESSDRAKTWHENCALFLMCLERVADAADARFKCLWPDLHKFVAPRAKLEATERDLAAARADQRAVAVAELKAVRDGIEAVRLEFWRLPGADASVALCERLVEPVYKRIAALTAPAAEPEKPEPVPGDRTPATEAFREASAAVKPEPEDDDVLRVIADAKSMGCTRSAEDWAALRELCRRALEGK